MQGVVLRYGRQGWDWGEVGWHGVGEKTGVACAKNPYEQKHFLAGKVFFSQSELSCGVHGSPM